MATSAATKDQSFGPCETDPKVNAASIEKLITARIGLLLRAPFFGNMATRLTLENADDWCGTAATDGRKLYFNSRFIERLSIKEIEFLLGHEILHNCYSHVDRCGHRMKDLYNVACDYVVNADLIDQKIGDKITSVPMLFNPDYKGLSSEEVYDLLLDSVDTDDGDDDGDADSNGSDQDGGTPGSGGKEGPKKKNSKSNKSSKLSLDELLKKLLDEHLDGDEGDEGKDGDEGGDKGKNGKGKRPTLTEEEKKQIRDEVKEAMISAAQACGAGNTPLGVKRMLKELLEPKMNWRELLQQQIESVIKSDFTWLRPSRRAWHCDAILPGMKPGETIDIAVAIDTSGSISTRMLQEFLSEVKGIMDSYDDYKITVWTFDTAVYNPQVFTQDNSDDLLAYDIQGGGGTDFMANWVYMREHDVSPKKLVVFTDGFPYGSWGEEDYCDTVWIINGNNQAQPPFGVWAHYNETKV